MIGPDRLRSVESFTYVGSVFSVAATADDEVKNRIAKACAAFGKLSYNADIIIEMVLFLFYLLLLFNF